MNDTLLIYINFFMGIAESFAVTYAVYMFLNEVDRSVYLKKRYYIAMYLVMAVGFYLIGIFFHVYANMFFLVTYSMIAGYFMFHRNKIQIIYTFLFVNCLYCVFTGTIQLAYWGISKIGIESPSIYIIGSFVIILKILAVLGLSRWFIHFLNGRVQKEYSRKQTLAFALLASVGFLFLMMLYSVMEVVILYYVNAGLMLGALFGILIVFNILVSDMLGMRIKNKVLKDELRLYNQQSKIQYSYYTDLEAKYQNSRKIIHDIRNHLHAVERLYNTQQDETGNKYAKDIHHMLNQLGQKYYCDNKMLNIILNDKLENVIQYNSRITVEIGDIHLEWMRDIDITTIFANLLDNSLHAIREMNENGFLSIKMDEHNQFLVVEIKNSIRSKNSYEKKKGDTSGGSGIGLKNVRSVVEKYDGTLDIKNEEETFAVNIVLPLKK